MSNRFAMSGLTAGQLNAIVKKLGGQKDSERFLSNEFLLVDPTKAKKGASAAKPLFTFVGRFRTEGTKEFVAAKKFVVDTSENARVKISYIGSNFKKHILPVVECDIAASDIVLLQLIRGQLDLPLNDEQPGIIAGLGGTSKAVTGAYEFFETLAYKQAMGDLTPTVGYVLVEDKDGNKVLWPVSACWRVGGWDVGVGSVASPYEWGAGVVFLSR